ncbi:MAG: hypothetical protein LBQ58_02880 [Synergistaceae bacterium]|jgi:hypothetical protein|nr:hypothetical protein [Synergistaceae bacterium]
MKYLKIFTSFIFVLIVFFIGLCFFAPWSAGGVYILDSIRLNAARKGVYISYNNMRADGAIFPIYHIESIDIESPVSKITVSDITVKMRTLASLLLRGVSFSAYFGNTDILVIPNNSVNLQRGNLNLSATRNAISVSDTDIEGEISVTGDIVYNLVQKKVTESSVAIKVPPNINVLLSSPLLSGYVESTNPGEWRIRYNAVQNRP